MGERWPWESGTEWLRGVGAEVDVVMSSRIRLARNLAGFPFMAKATATDAAQVLDLFNSIRQSTQLFHGQVFVADAHAGAAHALEAGVGECQIE